jgi:hypothetical protein
VTLPYGGYDFYLFSPDPIIPLSPTKPSPILDTNADACPAFSTEFKQVWIVIKKPALAGELFTFSLLQ